MTTEQSQGAEPSPSSASAPAPSRRSLFRILGRASRKDLLLGIPLIPIYSSAEVSLAFLAAALLRLMYFESPRVPVAELLPEALRGLIVFPQTVDRKDLAFSIPLLIIGVGLIKLVSSFLSTYFMERAGFRVSTVLREELLNRLLHSRSEDLQSLDAVDASNRVMVDTTLMQSAVSKGALSGLRDSVLLLFCVTGMVVVAQELFFVIAACVLPFAWGVRALAKVLHRYLQESVNRQVALSTHAMESRRGLLTLAAERLRRVRYLQFLGMASELREHARRSRLVRTISGPMIEYLAVAGVAVLLAFKNSLGEVDVSSYASLLILGAMTYRPLKNISSVVSQMSEIRVTFQRLKTMWELGEAKRDAEKLPAPVPQISTTRLAEARNVSYLTDDGKTLLNKVSVHANAGEIVAFVGASGNGKTTALRLLSGVLAPHSGQLVVPRQVRLATQKPYVFEGTVRDNLVYHQDSLDGAEVGVVTDLGLAHSQMGAGLFLDRELSPTGEGLSGGEQARVSLGRVLAAAAAAAAESVASEQEPEQRGSGILLLFDEPTASLDRENTLRFWQSLRRRVSESPSCAAFVVTHVRADTRYCDRVYEFSEGAVTEIAPEVIEPS